MSIMNKYSNDRDYDVENCVLLMLSPERIVREHDLGFHETI